MTQPLAGLTVVSIEQAVAAPLATRHLADLGARVIKVERPGQGDFARTYDETVNGQSSYFIWLNRSKESLTLDLRSKKGLAILRSLLDKADVFVQNLGPGASHRLGLDAETLGRDFPQLIVADLSGYGSFGPLSDRKAYDLLVQGESGLMSITGWPDCPSRVGISIADISAGMYLYSGILTALYMRATAGAVTTVSLALFEAMAEWMGAPAYYTSYSGMEPQKIGPHHATIAPYGAYPSADGSLVLLAVQNEREWKAFCEFVLGDGTIAVDPRFAQNSARVQHRSDLDVLVYDRFRRTGSDEIIAILDDARIANARLRDIHEFLHHPSLRERGRWREIASPAGMIEALVPPVDLKGVDPVMGAVPALGEHTDVILAELGIHDDEIQLLHHTEIV